MKRFMYLSWSLFEVFTPFVFYDTHDAWQISKFKDTQSASCFMVSVAYGVVIVLVWGNGMC